MKKIDWFGYFLVAVGGCFLLSIPLFLAVIFVLNWLI